VAALCAGFPPYPTLRDRDPSTGAALAAGSVSSTG